jgi:microcystin-dependent protein
MSSPFVAQIKITGCNFAQTGWAFCNGQLMPISQNTALFSLLGTYYGGDGKSTFALPDFQGSLATHQGQGGGLQEWFLGQQEGSETVTLLVSEMPAHNHQVMARPNLAGGIDVANGNSPALGAWVLGVQSGVVQAYATNAPNAAMAIPQALLPAGGDQPHNNMMPTLTMTYVIALQGVFPPRQ